METYNAKLEERKRFLKYFRVWIIIAAIAAVAFGVLKITHKDPVEEVVERNNDVAPSERVYDYADVLSDAEERELSDLIAELEKKCECDLVLVTINQAVGESDYEWEQNMVSLADDFYDKYAFGYDQPHGDGAVLLDNWYHVGQSDSQAGSWLSTSGKLEYAIGSYEEGKVFDEMDYGFETSTYKGYAMALNKIATYGMDGKKQGSMQLPWLLVLIIPPIISAIYAGANMKQAPGKDTTNSTTYVPGGRPMMNDQRDEFLRKAVTKVKIESSSSSRSGGGGSYGHHTSSGGFSHGGGGRRR